MNRTERSRITNQSEGEPTAKVTRVSPSSVCGAMSNLCFGNTERRARRTRRRRRRPHAAPQGQRSMRFGSIRRDRGDRCTHASLFHFSVVNQIHVLTYLDDAGRANGLSHMTVRVRPSFAFDPIRYYCFLCKIRNPEGGAKERARE